MKRKWLKTFRERKNERKGRRRKHGRKKPSGLERRPLLSGQERGFFNPWPRSTFRLCVSVCVCVFLPLEQVLSDTGTGTDGACCHGSPRRCVCVGFPVPRFSKAVWRGVYYSQCQRVADSCRSQESGGTIEDRGEGKKCVCVGGVMDKWRKSRREW